MALSILYLSFNVFYGVDSDMADAQLRKNAAKVLFLAVFVAAGLVAMRINFSAVLGAENQYFNLFQFFAPAAGGFLGGLAGAAAVLAMQVVDFLFVGKEFTLLNVARLFTLAAAAWYFASPANRKRAALIPALAMLLFVLHPVGREAWYYAVLFWSIPILGNLLARSLGATFTAHSLGSIIWLYTLPTTPAFWTALIPIVVFERMLFAGGIAVSFVFLNALFSRVRVPSFVRVDCSLPFVRKAGAWTR